MLKKLRTEIKTAVEQKAVKIVVNHFLKQINMTTNKSWKTTVTGIVVGSMPIIDALIQAYNAGAFTGKTGLQLAMGIGIIVLGALAKDGDKTGLPTKTN